ncbi:hypothetical protein [Sphingobacterium sp. 2149]|uniref:hypothetical protein n=1 Tax=Sphingobacterium sp. 2149 TaxID=2817763 RepID=UPI0028669168|nr:hypothetical protein [Sphingobacterium sp. 2149]MDR6733456.1 hypothetical protein [Sphingobacterium sp. 2149]
MTHNTYSRQFPLHRHQTIHHSDTCEGRLSQLHPDLFENKDETKSKNPPGLYKARVAVQSLFRGIDIQDVPYT